MTMREFLKQNRDELTRITKATNDAEREQWVMNDEGLYNWARSEGVKI